MCGHDITRGKSRDGIETIQCENSALELTLLLDKGADITELRDKSIDGNLLFESPHRWRAPSSGYGSAPDGQAAFLDHYPGGWQTVLPSAGGPASVGRAEFGAHGEAAIIPWTLETSSATSNRVELELATELTRYPLSISRRLVLHDSTLSVEDTVQNLGETTVPYQWVQHIAFGQPLIGPNAQLDVPCERVLVDERHVENARIPTGAEFDWPVFRDADGEAVDLRTFPENTQQVHDNAVLVDLKRGEYSIRNPTINTEVVVSFDSSVYNSLWYWGAYGGFENSPFYGREYVLGLEPASSTTKSGLDDAISDGTARRLAPQESVTATTSVHVPTATNKP